jgi:hypothetical protein
MVQSRRGSKKKTTIRCRKRSRSCPKNQIRRKSYRTKIGTLVKSRCIRDLGRPGKGPNTLPPIGKPGFLSKHGYSLNKEASARHRSLKRASAKGKKTLEVLRHLNLISNYTSVPKNKKKMRADVEYLKKEYVKDKKKSKR